MTDMPNENDGLDFFVDFSEVEDGRSFDAVPPGRYNVEVESVHLRPSQSSDHPYLNWTLRILDGPHEKRYLWLVTSFAPASLPMMKMVFVSAGINGRLAFKVDNAIDQNDAAKGGRLLLEPDMVGYQGSAKVKNEKYEGDMQAKVTGLQLKPKAGAQIPLPTGSPAPPQQGGAARRFV